MFWIESGAGASRLSAMSTTPASRPTASMKSRPRSAMLSITSPVSTPAFSDEPNCTGAASAVTVTLSVTSPTVSTIAPSERWSPELSAMPFCW